MKLGTELNQQVLEKAGKLGGKTQYIIRYIIKKVESASASDNRI